MSTFTVKPRGPFNIGAAAHFLRHFGAASYGESAREDHVHFAFVDERDGRPAGVCLRQEDHLIIGDVFGDADPQVVERQVSRIVSLDYDSSDFGHLADHDRIISDLQQAHPGLRPVLFSSPFDAACWAVISQRVQMKQAAVVKSRIAEQLGESVDIHGRPHAPFPAPEKILELEQFSGLFGRKAEHLRGLAAAALEGRLDADELRSRPSEEALFLLKKLPGIGDFSAELILLRGAGTRDVLPVHEPHLRHAVMVLYGLNEPPTTEELESISDAWRPYRTWISFLLRVSLRHGKHEPAISS